MVHRVRGVHGCCVQHSVTALNCRSDRINVRHIRLDVHRSARDNIEAYSIGAEPLQREAQGCPYIACTACHEDPLPIERGRAGRIITLRRCHRCRGSGFQRVSTPLTAENEGQISRVSAHWVLNMPYGDI